jgi:hypothetical protein
MRKIKGVFVDVNARTVEPITLHYNSYKDLYPLLNCETFDVTSRKFGNRVYDVYCDDEGLLGDDWIPSALSEEQPENDFLVGNLFVCSHTKNGDIASLTDEQIEEVLKTRRYIKIFDDSGNIIITQVLLYNYRKVDA